MTARTPELSGVPTVSTREQDRVPLIGFESVTKRYRGGVTALDQVSLALPAGVTLGLVGESGSGKSTCVGLALGLERPTAGRLTFRGQSWAGGPAGRPQGLDSCVFADRCPAVADRCRTERPPVVTEADGRTHACFFPLP
jgi:ABC-type glutathione transport system ATPase component